jgi:hypothetical protein
MSLDSGRGAELGDPWRAAQARSRPRRLEAQLSEARLRQNWLSNRIFKSFDDIVDHCCYAWNTLIDQPWKIMSIARDWAAIGHSN